MLDTEQVLVKDVMAMVDKRIEKSKNAALLLLGKGHTSDAGEFVAIMDDMVSLKDEFVNLVISNRVS